MLCCHHLVELGPGHRHVAKVVSKVGLVEDLLGQEVLVVLVQVVARLDLGGEFAVESAVHPPPGNSLRHYERHSVLVAAAKKGRCVNDSHSSHVSECQERVCDRPSFQTCTKNPRRWFYDAVHLQATRGSCHKHFEYIFLKLLQVTFICS